MAECVGENVCGVIGYYSAQPLPAHGDHLAALLRESQIRGRHAFGCAWRTETGIEVRRSLQGQVITDTLCQLFADKPPQEAMAFCRYSTSGDWREMRNNQPLAIDGTVLIFNGVLDMRTPTDWQRDYGGTYQTANDGELFIRHGLRDPIAFVRHGSFAGCWMTPVGFYALRNQDRPLWWRTDATATWLASTQDILRRVVGPGREVPAHTLCNVRDMTTIEPAHTAQTANRVLAVAVPAYKGHIRHGSRLARLSD